MPTIEELNRLRQKVETLKTEASKAEVEAKKLAGEAETEVKTVVGEVESKVVSIESAVKKEL